MGGKYCGQTVDYYERGRGWDQDYGGGRVAARKGIAVPVGRHGNQ